MRRNAWHGLVSLYSSLFTLFLNAVLFLAYYYLFTVVIEYSNFGIFLVTVPVYLVFLLVLTSSMLATAASVYLRRSLRLRRVAIGLSQSPIAFVVGTVVASCACNVPILAPVLYLIGLNALEVSSAIAFLARFQEPIIGIIVLLNVCCIYYYLGLLSRETIHPRPVTVRNSMPS